MKGVSAIRYGIHILQSQCGSKFAGQRVMLNGLKRSVFTTSLNRNTSNSNSTEVKGSVQSEAEPLPPLPIHPSAKETQVTEIELEKQLSAELTKANTEAAKLSSKLEDLEDKYKRALAESENMRTRLTKQINEQKLHAIQGFCRDLTEIDDILRLAIDSVPKNEINSRNKNLKDLYEGLTMTEARLLQVFKMHGLTQLNPLNQKFNPNEHEAVMQMEDPEKESGTVIFVSKLGYKLHDRVIRPAIVGVAK